MKIRVRKKSLVLVAFLAVIVAAVSGCQTIGYYAQAVKGEYRILAAREPIDKVIADPKTPEDVRQKLQLVERLRAYARDSLKLPVDKYYLTYSDVHRKYVVWNVQAAPRFSLQPITWWYPIVGSLEYRGYFSEAGANKCAAPLAKKGDDVYVDGVEAYSTLGWFKDPILSTFITQSEAEVAEVLFHELGHKRVFAPGDTDFNEAYATTVGEEGARRWLRANGETNLLDKYQVALGRDSQFVHLILDTRKRLEKVYGDTLDKDGQVTAAKIPPAPPAEMEREKDRILGDMYSQYEKLKASWGGYTGYDDWFAGKVNNAQLNTIANYYDYLPSFKRLLELNGGNMEKFYQEVQRLANMSEEERHQWLRVLAK